MAMLIEFEGISPIVAESAFLAPPAVLVGDVQVGEGSSIWFGAVLRGDLGPIRVGADVIHAETERGTVLEDRTTIGHGAILHDCWIGASSLIGMGAVVLDGARVGPEAIVAASSVVREGFKVPARMLAAGAPATNKKALEGEAARWIERGAEDNVKLVERYRGNWKIMD